MADLTTALSAASVGAARVGEHFGSRFDTTFKSQGNPVTSVDRDAEQAIIEVLRAQAPDDSVLAEETGGRKWDRGRVWIVDPLDGTVNFVHSIPHVSVSVGLYENGRPLVGAVVDPLRNEVFTGGPGIGSTLNGAPIGVSKTDELIEAMIATGFPYDRNIRGPSYADVVGAMLTRAQGIRRMGSAALDAVWVACGRYDAFWEFGTSAWDMAGGIAVLIGAGGTATNHLGESPALDSSGFVLSNGLVHDDVVELIGDHLPEHIK